MSEFLGDKKVIFMAKPMREMKGFSLMKEKIKRLYIYMYIYNIYIYIYVNIY